MPTFGRQQLTQTGTLIQVAAAGDAEWKPGGITLDWSTVGAVVADTTLGDGTIVKAGQKGLEYGVILAQITASGKYGLFTPAIAGVTLTAATVAGTTTLPVSAGAGILPGDSLLVDTGATQETVLVVAVAGNTVTTAAPTTQAHAAGVAVAKPNDGRQTLGRGTTFILNQSVLQYGINPLVATAGDHPAVFEGGTAYKARLKVGGAGQPTFAQVETALPRLRYAQM